MPKLLSKSQFKPHALEVMRQVEKTGEPVIITDHGKPTLELRAYKDRIAEKKPPDYLKGSVLGYTDPFEPAIDDSEWEASQ